MSLSFLSGVKMMSSISNSRKLSVFLLVIPLLFYPSIQANQGNTLPDQDGDGIADFNDICPADPENKCEAAEECLKLMQGIIATGVMGSYFTIAGGLLAAVPGVGTAGAVGVLIGSGIFIAIELFLQYEFHQNDCAVKLGW